MILFAGLTITRGEFEYHFTSMFEPDQLERLQVEPAQYEVWQATHPEAITAFTTNTAITSCASLYELCHVLFHLFVVISATHTGLRCWNQAN
jgi:hypothetical protein